MAVIRHSLDLVLYFIDTTTRLGIYTPPIRLYKDGVVLRFQRRSAGQVLVVGCGREDFDLTVELSGFEHMTTRVEYDKLDKQMPLLQLHMIPTPSDETLALAGTLQGITALDAIPAMGSYCLLEKYEAKKRQITVFSQFPLALDNLYYAVRNDEANSYTPFSVLRQIPPKNFVVDRVLESPANGNMPIQPVNKGQVRPDGSYLLRVRDESRQVQWIVRWQVGEQEFFKMVDFHETDTITL